MTPSRTLLAALVALAPVAPAPAQPPAPDEPAVFRVPPGGGWVMTPDLVTLVLAFPEDGRLVYLDTVSNTVTTVAGLDFKPGALALQGQTLFAATSGSALVYALDLPTAKVTKEFNVGGAARGAAPGPAGTLRWGAGDAPAHLRAAARPGPGGGPPHLLRLALREHGS